MAQQTAVEWLIQELIKEGYYIPKGIGEQAKSMEKEQIMDAYWNGTTDMEKQDALNDAEKFYNEYYKN